MAKQTDATVFYCDKCKKPIIGTFTNIKEADYFQVAHHVPQEYIELQNDQLPSCDIFSAPVVGKIEYPEVSLNTIMINNDGSSNLGLKVDNKIKYLCEDCLDEILDKYTDLCNKFYDLWMN